VLAYETRGAGPPLLLLHGITESRRAWDPLIPALAADHYVIAVDLRGHGESPREQPYDPFTMAADAIGVTRAVGASEPLVIGHSLGAAIASLYAANAPARGVVNIDQPLELGGFKELLMSVEPMLRGDDASFQAVMRNVFDMLAGPLPASERERVLALRHPEQEVVLGVWGTVLESDPAELDALMSSGLAAITAPYLALHGEPVGDTYEEWLSARINRATFELWPGLGHYPHLIEPERFVARVREFEAQCA
jgi:pimeloyl-ACP methyl ester carboxylesterase